MGYHKKNHPILTADLIFILNFIEEHGHHAMVVGGAVRNFLLNVKISDIDIATTATPQEIINIFSKSADKFNCDISLIPIGKKYGTVAVIYNGKPYEITTLREDIKTFGRKAEVAFSKSFEIDSNRRDFTINAIYMNRHGEIFDYHNGMHDIYEKNIKFIGDPVERIKEDYLRIFRYFRFVSYYGNFRCNKDYLSMMNTLRQNMLILSIERITAELLKIFELENCYKIIPQMRFVLDTFFHLQHDALGICEKIKINHMTSMERMCMILKFSSIPMDQLIKKYKFPQKINKLLLLPYETDVKKKIKTISKELHSFYIKYVLVKIYIEGKYDASQLRQIEQNLLDFCKSEYADFRFKVSHINEFNLSKEMLKEVMIATKKFWMESDNVGLEECIAFAKNIIKQY